MLTHRSVSLSTPWSMTAALIVAAAVTLLVAMAFSTWQADSPAAPAVAEHTFGNVPETLVDQRANIENGFAEARRARTDMFVHALEHGMAVEAEHAFGPMAGFDAQWDLYYADVITADGMVTLYTAVYKDEPLIRYTATWDPANGCATSWQPVIW